MLGFYRDDGKENGKHYSLGFRISALRFRLQGLKGVAAYRVQDSCWRMKEEGLGMGKEG